MTLMEMGFLATGIAAVMCITHVSVTLMEMVSAMLVTIAPMLPTLDKKMLTVTVLVMLVTIAPTRIMIMFVIQMIIAQVY
jgi:hypothetical protein